MKLKPLGDRVIVKPLTQEEVTKSGIVLPDTVEKEKKEQGEVVAVGPGRLNEKGIRNAPEVKVGDRVLFGKYAGEDAEIDGVEYKVLKEEDVLAVVE